LLRAVTGFVREIAAATPVALLLDDLHWVDDASLDLLAHLSRHTRGDRVLLLGTYRDVEVGRGHPLREAVRDLGREQLVQKIGVRRLGPEETAALMSDRLDGSEVSEEFAGLVYDHTEGNPFFVVEVLKALVERGDLLRWEGRWIRKEIEDLAAPESVSEAILERVSRLQPQTQIALEEALEEAEASGLVWAVRDRYAFDHALTQQTLYAGLSHAHRKRLHRSAGEGLEKLGEQQKRAAEISRHFVEGRSPARALPYALLAGDKAERHYQSALELAEEVGDGSAASQALEKLGGVLATTVRYDEALVALQRVANGARNDPEGASRVEARIARTHFRRGTKNEGDVRLSAHLESLDKPGASEGVRHGGPLRRACASLLRPRAVRAAPGGGTASLEPLPRGGGYPLAGRSGDDARHRATLVGRSRRRRASRERRAPRREVRGPALHGLRLVNAAREAFVPV
jgi:tetratricopeptide (TPR) repeat protein